MQPLEQKTPSLRSRPAALTITDAAAARIRELMAGAGPDVMGLRVGVRARGCSGMSYTIDFAKEKSPLDEIIQDKGVTILIESSALMFLIGSEMDFVDDSLQSTFTFRNPNEKGRCGCGESFHT